MMKLRKTLYFVLCLMVGVYMSGCIEEYEADIAEDDSNLLVVEGTICSAKQNKFTLSRTQALNSTYTPRMVMGARVSVRGSDGSEFMTQATNGYYSCWIDTLVPDVTYYLHVEIDGEVYESEPQKPLRTEKIADVRGVQNTPESHIDVLITPAEPFDPDRENYYSWTYDETWEVYPEYKTSIYYDIETGRPVYDPNQFPKRGWKDATGPTIAIGSSTSYGGQHIRRLKMYDIDRSDERMFYRYSGLVHQRAISKAEYEYELARRQAASEMGGLFTPQPSALPTNIHCLTSSKHVIGYVGCSLNTSEYRFFFNAGDFSIYHPSHDDTRLWVDNPSWMDCFYLIARDMHLCEWDGPSLPDNVLHTAWAYGYQLDVRYGGAYIEEPDFWSLKENVSY